MRAKNSLPSHSRLRKRKELSELFQQGKVLGGSGLRVRYLKAGPSSRLVISFNRKAGTAPLRNLWKRHIREEFRQDHALRDFGVMLGFYSPLRLPTATIRTRIQTLFSELKKELRANDTGAKPHKL